MRLFLTVILATVILRVSVVSAASLEEVATSDMQWTGIAISQSGRMFVNFPRWSPDVPISVAEIDEAGKLTAFPNSTMNGWKIGEKPDGKFVCVQSLTIDTNNHLWILDPAAPVWEEVVPGGARLFAVDLDNDEVVRTIHFDESIAPPGSYLNDVRVDVGTQTAYVTDSNLGAIIVVDLDTGESRRLLTSHPSTQVEDIEITVRGTPFPYPVAADGIALDVDGGWVYFQALTARTLYRVPTDALRDESLSAEALGRKVERFSEGSTTDGMLFTAEGVYLTSFEEDAIKLVDRNGSTTTVVSHPLISWPDALAIEPNGNLVFTTSQVHIETEPPEPYRILRIVSD